MPDQVQSAQTAAPAPEFAHFLPLRRAARPRSSRPRGGGRRSRWARTSPRGFREFCGTSSSPPPRGARGIVLRVTQRVCDPEAVPSEKRFSPTSATVVASRLRAGSLSTGQYFTLAARSRNAPQERRTPSRIMKAQYGQWPAHGLSSAASAPVTAPMRRRCATTADVLRSASTSSWTAAGGVFVMPAVCSTRCAGDNHAHARPGPEGAGHAQTLRNPREGRSCWMLWPAVTLELSPRGAYKRRALVPLRTRSTPCRPRSRPDRGPG